MLATPVEVKKACKEGVHRKNYRFVVLNDGGTEDFTIDNDTLVAESVHIDERMVSGSVLKFGLCEGSSLEFQYFNLPNINGRRIRALVDVQYVDANNDLSWYTIPMGFFTVEKCSRQASTGIQKVTAYNKLQSQYLDAKANDLIDANMENEDFTNDMSLYTLLNKCLGEFAIDTSTEEQVVTYSVASGQPGGVVMPTPCDHVVTLKDSNGQATGFYLHILQVLFSELDDAPIYYSVEASEQLAHATTDLWNNFFSSDLRKSYYISGTNQTLINLYDYITTKQYDDVIGVFGHYFKGSIEWQHISSPYETLDTHVGIMNNYIDELKLPFRYVEHLSAQLQTPFYLWVNNSSSLISNASASTYFLNWKNDYISNWAGIYARGYMKILSPMEMYRVTADDFEADVTLRELQSAVYETKCQYGQLDRVTDLFLGVELNGGGLYPAETLYPANSLYPNSNTGGQGIHPYPSEYSQLWTDTISEQSFRYLIITYRTLDGNSNEVDAVLQMTVNADGTTDYNMSDNWLFRNLVWTQADIEAYAAAMVTKMQNIRWFPFEMWAAGLPYVETGDAIEITDREGNTHNSYILQRQLQGIQNLQDTYVNGELDIF